MISENLLGVINTWHYLPIIMVSIVLLIIILNQLLYQPVLKIIDERKKFMHDMKEKAHGLREKSQELARKYDVELAQEKKETFKELEIKKKDVLKKNQEEIQKAKVAAEGFVLKELDVAYKSCEAAKKELAKEIEHLSAEVIEKIYSLGTHKAHAQSELSTQTKGEL